MYCAIQGALDSEVQLAYLVELLCPHIADIAYFRRSISPKLWSQLIKQRDDNSLRKLAKRYGISHGAVRRIISKSLDF